MSWIIRTVVKAINDLAETEDTKNYDNPSGESYDKELFSHNFQYINTSGNRNIVKYRNYICNTCRIKFSIMKFKSKGEWINNFDYVLIKETCDEVVMNKVLQ